MNKARVGHADPQVRLNCSNDEETTGDGAGLPQKHECSKSLREFNKETARYSSLVLALGGSRDGEILREELKRIRKHSNDLARHNKNVLLPHLKSQQMQNQSKQSKELSENERLMYYLTSCLSVYETQLVRTLILQTSFPLNSQFSEHRVSFIQTGMQDAFFGCNFNKTHSNSSIRPTTTSDKEKSDFDDRDSLEIDIVEIKNMLNEIKQVVNTNQWNTKISVEDVDKIESINSIETRSKGSTSSIADLQTDDVGFLNSRRRKNACYVSVALLVVIAVAVIIGVCVAILSNQK